MAFLKYSLILLFSISPLAAQFTIQEVGDDSTEAKTINMNVTEDTEGTKSEWGAAFLSLAVPGAGQMYLGQKRKGGAYIAADLLLLTGVIFSEATSRRKFESSMGFARVHAGTNSSRDRDDNYWNELGLYDSTITDSKQWNDALATKYRDFAKEYKGADSWDWGHSDYESKEHYVEMRSDAATWHSAAYFFVGGMIVNRVVSFIDARISAKRYNTSLLSTVQIQPHYSLLDGTAGLTLTTRF